MRWKAPPRRHSPLAPSRASRRPRPGRSARSTMGHGAETCACRTRENRHRPRRRGNGTTRCSVKRWRIIGAPMTLRNGTPAGARRCATTPRGAPRGTRRSTSFLDTHPLSPFDLSTSSGTELKAPQAQGPGGRNFSLFWLLRTCSLNSPRRCPMLTRQWRSSIPPTRLKGCCSGGFHRRKSRIS